MSNFLKRLEDSRVRLVNGESPMFAIYIAICVGVCVFFLLPPLLTCERISILNFNDTGQIGDTIGGIAGPVIAFIASLLTFLAFWVQYQSNLAQKLQFYNQDKDTKIERFENKFYELLKIHRDNVDEIRIGDVDFKRRAFVKMFLEFKCSYLILQNAYNKAKHQGILSEMISTEQLVDIAYTYFFIGIGESSDKSTNHLLQKYPNSLLAIYSEELKKAKEFHRQHRQLTLEYQDKTAPPLTAYFSYSPFDGHMSRLGHYYRNLFQIVKFVVAQDASIIANKNEYLKTLRAQLSSHEQLLLYYNGLSNFGNPWIKNGYFTEFTMIKNIPLPLADFGVSPTEKLGKKNSKGEFIFEWDELVEK